MFSMITPICHVPNFSKIPQNFGIWPAATVCSYNFLRRWMQESQGNKKLGLEKLLGLRGDLWCAALELLPTWPRPSTFRIFIESDIWMVKSLLQEQTIFKVRSRESLRVVALYVLHTWLDGILDRAEMASTAAARHSSKVRFVHLCV